MGGAGGEGGYEGDMGRELQMQDRQIEELTRQIQDVEQQNEMLRQQRPRVGQIPQIDPNDQYQ